MATRKRLSAVPGLTWSLGIGLFVAAAIAVGGLAYVAQRPVRWSARASTLVHPGERADLGALAAYYEALSRGQIVVSYAEIVRLQRFQSKVASYLGLSRGQRGQVTVEVTVVPDSAVIALAATAPTAELAEEMADDVLSEASAYIAELSEPYGVTTISDARGTAVRHPVPMIPLVLVILTVAVVAGIAAQQAVFQMAAVMAAVRAASEVVIPGDRPSAERSAVVRT